MRCHSSLPNFFSARAWFGGHINFDGFACCRGSGPILNDRKGSSAILGLVWGGADACLASADSGSHGGYYVLSTNRLLGKEGISDRGCDADYLFVCGTVDAEELPRLSNLHSCFDRGRSAILVGTIYLLQGI